MGKKRQGRPAASSTVARRVSGKGGAPSVQRILVIDVGGSHVKFILGRREEVKFPSGPEMEPERMVRKIRKLTADWEYDAVSIGYPGAVRRGRIARDPHNLGEGWVNFDFRRAFGAPVKVVNDAAMQALGSYRGGVMLFLGLGTGLGTALVINGVAESRELSHFPYRKGTLEDYVGFRGMQRLGKKKWRQEVDKVVTELISRIHVDDV